MSFPEPVRACDDHAHRLRVHAGRELHHFLELRAHLNAGDVSDGIEDGEGRARVVDDLVREETWERIVV